MPTTSTKSLATLPQPPIEESELATVAAMALAVPAAFGDHSGGGDGGGGQSATCQNFATGQVITVQSNVCPAGFVKLSLIK